MHGDGAVGGNDLLEQLAIFPVSFPTDLACEKPGGKVANSDIVIASWAPKCLDHDGAVMTGTSGTGCMSIFSAPF